MKTFLAKRLKFFTFKRPEKGEKGLLEHGRLADHHKRQGGVGIRKTKFLGNLEEINKKCLKVRQKLGTRKFFENLKNLKFFKI